MTKCELCNRLARMYCESDQASLCWDCDALVHLANFLVERHPRVLLCQRCQAPTPWRATGARLTPIISVCDRCTDIDMASSAGEEDAEEPDDYQVVPWRLTPPPLESSSSRDESSLASSGKANSNFLKRIRENADLSSESDSSSPISQRHRLDLSIQAPFTSLFVVDKRANQASASFSPSQNHRRSFLQSTRQLSAGSAGTGRRVYTRRASTAVDRNSSASYSPPI